MLVSKDRSTSGALPPSPPEAWEPLHRMARLATRPLERFLRIQAASGLLLLVSAGIALVWANSSWAGGYARLWHTPVGLRIGAFAFERPLAWVVNDGLMTVFFFVVGMEIRRELHHGELSSLRRAALPVAAALGGTLAPAAVYLLVARHPGARSGWAVPMATDIAFAVGILTLLGRRVPPALRVLLLALAVIDDLGAIVVIALFYSTGFSISGLAVAAAGLGGTLVMQRLGVRTKLAYVVPAVVVWAGVYAAGVHPTIAGVAVGVMTPVRAWLGPDGFVDTARGAIDSLAGATPNALSSHELAGRLRRVDHARREAMSPAESLIETLHPWVAFLIMPIFALANAGVSLSGSPLDDVALGVLWGAGLGLLVGKPAGVLLLSALALRLRLATLPAGVGARHLAVLGVVAGIGFTMSIFLAQLAFVDETLLTAAKLGVIAASAAAMVLGLVLGRLLLTPTAASGAAESADEAEGSMKT